MVDVGGKAITAREAIAEARVSLGRQAFVAVRDATVAKGDVLGTARIAGILAAKRCAELIPLCHSLPLSFAGVEFVLEPETASIRIRASCRTDHRTGVEMEAMTAASVAALTLYDMCKGVDKGIIVESVRLVYKSGGKSGTWRCDEAQDLPPRPIGDPALPHGDGSPTAFTEAVGSAPRGANAAMEAATGVGVNTPVAAPGAGARLGAGDDPRGADPAAAAVTPPGVRVPLAYFAQVAELAGRRADVYDGELPVRGRQLLAWLERRHPALAPAGRLQLAINQQHARADDWIRPGDEVAVFEPVTGG